MSEPRSGRALRSGRSFWLHLHPPRVHADTLRPTTTLGLGVLAVTLLALLVVTGVVLMLLYTPSPERAHGDLRDIAYAVPFGRLLRNVHRLATHGLVVVVALHMLRVLLVAAYRGRRWLNWLVGLGLLGTTLGLAFTGYLLPWDQTAYWACTVGADMMGLLPGIGPALRSAFLAGDEVSARSLLRFYVLHVGVLPGLGLGLVVYHLWRVRKDGGLALHGEDRS
ncbi:MAG: cytochrome b N-terminal domain-containing protein [Pseudomonadota bacterium]